MIGGAHSAAYTGTVADLGPTPNPRKKRAMKRCHHVLVTPCQIQVANEKNALMKMVPRRPKRLLSGAETQQLTRPQHNWIGDQHVHDKR